VSAALADVPVELRNMVLTGNMNGRSGVDFTDKANNVSAFVPKGTRGTVLEVRKLSKTRSFGIKMKVTEVSGQPSKAKNAVTKDQEVWVYFSSTKENWLKFRDADGSVVQDPEIALTAQAKRDGSALPAVPGTLKNPQLPTTDEVIRESAPSEDPNLTQGKNARNETEGSFCPFLPCAERVSFNDRNIQQVEEAVNMMSPVEEKAKINTPEKILKKEKTKTENPTEQKPQSSKAIPGDKWAAYPELTEWQNGTGNKLAVHAVRNARGFGGYCYAKVKRYTMANKLVDTYLPGGHARDAVRDLLAQNKKKNADPKYKWVNLLDDPRYKDKIKSPMDAPHGAIVVSWNGDRSSSGDIQVRNARPPKIGWVSDGYSPRTINDQPAGRRAARKGKPYKMTGVMVKIRQD
jgi:hypothetical protein